MELNHETLSAMRTSFNLKFKQAVEGAETIYRDLADIEGDPKHTAMEIPFLDAFAGMREWLGPRQIKNLATHKIRLVERPWEDTVAIPVRDVESDNWGIYGTLVAAMGEAGEQLWDTLFTEALVNPPNWIDGASFYNSSRKYGPSTINNVTTNALTFANFGSFFTQMYSVRGHNGQPVNTRPTHLIVGPALEDTAREILYSDTYRDSSDQEFANPHKDKVKLVVSPRLTGTNANYWFLGRFTGALKPILVLKNKEASLTILNQPNDENVFMDGRILFGAEAYGNAAALFPHLLGRGGTAAG